MDIVLANIDVVQKSVYPAEVFVCTVCGSDLTTSGAEKQTHSAQISKSCEHLMPELIRVKPAPGK